LSFAEANMTTEPSLSQSTLIVGPPLPARRMNRSP
jgi:hypothetical protein